MKFRFLAACFIAAALGLAGAMGAPDAQPKPNILFILCDDLGYGMSVCFTRTAAVRTSRA